MINRSSLCLVMSPAIAFVAFARSSFALPIDSMPSVDVLESVSLDFKLDFGALIVAQSDRTALDVSLGALRDPPSDAASEKSAPGEPAPDSSSRVAPAESDATAIAKKLQNPVANLISLPIQWNINTNVGPDKQDQSVINIQPVIPFHISEEWNLITRTIVPIINTPVPDWETGLGDIQLSLFASPAAPSKFIWGVGPIFQFPTATDDAVGQGKWCAGPSFVGLVMDGPWVYGALVNQIWSFAGDDDREYVNQMLIQPFVNYNLPEGWYLTFSPIITANWEADSGDQWTLPLGGGVGKVFKLGDQMMNASMQTYYNVITPDFGPEWTLRFQLTFAFPQ
jgi:hypothetical protein